MKKGLKPKYLNHGRHPIKENGTYEIKWNCSCCGELNKKIVEVTLSEDGIPGFPCDCDEVPEPHYKIIPNHYFYRRIEDVS